MRKLLRYALVCAMTMISTASMATTVGNEDNTTGWWSAFSDYYTIAPNQTLTLEFTNYSNKAANWFNYMTVVTTDADRGATDYSEYIVYRADCYGWQYGMNTAENPELYKYKVDNFGDAFADFTNIMDGAKVVLTVKRINESVSIIADITSTGGAKYRSFYAMNCGDGSQTIRAFLTTENGHLVIDDALAGDGAFFQTVESSGIIFVGYDQKIGVFSRVDFFGFSFVQHFTFVHCRRPSIPYFPKGIITQCPVYFQYEKSPLRMQRGRG